jgi:peptidoglycan/xylan/chitin deacetylase (PgdA/CDA1 family)
MSWSADDAGRGRRRELARQRTRRQRLIATIALGAALATLVAVVAVTQTSDVMPAAADHDPPPVEPRQAANGPPPRAPEPAPAGSEPSGRAIPILMYHAVESPPPDAALPELWVPAERFAEEMDALDRAGYHAITMQDASDYWAGRRRVPRKPVVLTFDDGFRSHVDVALPVLQRLGWPGVLYLEVAALHTPGSGGMSDAGVRKLLRAGWELGSHTMTHPDLTTLDAEQLREEVAGARTFLRRRYRVPVDAFCYPAGRSDDTVVAAVEAAGYRSATTVDPGLAEPPGDRYRLPRLRVNGSDDAASLLARM